jgi:predicted dehydrogenase
VSDSMRIAVVGVGHLGQHHARILSEMPDVELVGVVDTDRNRVEEISERLGTKPYTNFEDLLGKVDAFSVVTPTELHGRIGARILETGHHLFIEKPITVTLEEADELIRLADQSHLVLQVGHIERFNPGMIALSEHLREPRFVEAHRLGPLPGRGHDVGVVLDLMIHDLDLVISLVKSPVVQCESFGIPVLTEQEDIANARIRFESGCVADLTVSRVTPERQRKIRIFQPDAYLSLDFLEKRLEVYRRGRDPDTGELRIEREVVEPPESDALTAELASFMHAVRTGAAPIVSGREGREALRLGLEILDRMEGP